MIEYFVGREKWPKGYQEALNCAAGFLLLRPTNRVMRDLVGPWRACALHRACIAPPGSTRLNHRQDQAALTYLAFTHNFTACKTYPNLYPKNAGLKHQMDNCPDAWTDLERRSLTLVKEELQRLGEELQMPGTDEADADIPS